MNKLILIFVASTLIGCIQRLDIESLDGTYISTSELDERIQQLMDNAGVAGLGICILNHNAAIYQKTFGYANYETKDSLQIDDNFVGASFSKAIFSYIVANLVEEGKLDLDVPLQHYLDVEIPYLPLEKEYRKLEALGADDRYKQITARMCLSHTTGLPNWRWIEDDKKLKYLYNPGERYNYSGEGIMILQWVVEHITQKKLEELAVEMVFEPLEMKNSSYLWRKDFEAHFCYGHNESQQKIPRDINTEDASAAGSLETTLEDYSSFIAHILQLETSNSKITQNMFSPNVRIRSKAQFGPLSHQDTTLYDDIQLSYGLGWGLLTSNYEKGVFKEGHDNGFQHYSIIFPEKQIGVIIMTNSNNGESIFKELLELTIADSYTPWQWENYIPYQLRKE